MPDFTDDAIAYRCSCGWTGRWDEAFGHIVSEGTHGDGQHTIVEPPVDALRTPVLPSLHPAGKRSDG